VDLKYFTRTALVALLMAIKAYIKIISILVFSMELVYSNSSLA